MTAELLSYVVVNGVQAKSYPFSVEVTTQKEIEELRIPLLRKHAKEKKIIWGEELNFEICFSIRKQEGSRLHP